MLLSGIASFLSGNGMIRVIFFATMSLLIAGCNPATKKYLHPKLPSAINVPAHKWNFLNTVYQFEIKNDTGSILYAFKNDTLFIARNLTDEITHIKVPKSGFFTNFILSGNNLLFLDGIHNILSVYTINLVQQQAALLKKIDLAPLFDAKNSALIYSRRNDLFIKGNIVYLRFGKFYESLNFSQRPIFYSLDISNENVTINDSLFSYPSSIRKRKRQETATYLFDGADNNLNCGFVSEDEIEIIKSKKTAQVIRKIGPYADFNNYNYNRGKDLGYVRHYVLTNERNIAVFFYKQRYVVVKKLKTSRLNEAARYDLYILDKDMQLISLSSFDFEPTENIFPYKNGIVIVDTSGKLNYYEF